MRMRNRLHIKIYVFLCIAHLSTVCCDNFIVSVASQDPAQMNAFTNAIDENSGQSLSFGSIEATMSRVVSGNDPYIVKESISSPTLTLIDDVSYDEANQTWNLQYRSMRSGQDHFNSFKRYLYMSKNGNVLRGDVTNPCLSLTVTDVDCLENLQSSYVTNETLTPNADALELPTPVSTTVTSQDGTLIETVLISIPHSVIRETIAERKAVQHPVDGNRIEWHFAVGMLFLSSASNFLIVDNFILVEHSNQLLAMSKWNSYAISQHVTFFTSQITNQPTIHIATVEIMLQPGFTLDHIDSAMNSQTITQTMCDDMQSLVDSLGSQKSCVSNKRICDTVSYTSAAGEQWVTMLLPVTTTDAKIELDLLIHANTTSGSILSSLNFVTEQQAQAICEDSTELTISPVDYTQAVVYRGSSLTAESVYGDFSVQNTSLSQIESLITLVLEPKEDAASAAYFARFSSERISLDDLYMSHFLDHTEIPDFVNNDVSTVDNGRAEIYLDSNITAVCMNEDDNTFAYPFSDEETTCVTTHDWKITPRTRPKSSSTMYFVRELKNDDSDLEWLTSIFLFPDRAENFRNSIVRKVGEPALSTTTKAYWIYPVYAWPNKSPLGLVDRTLIAFAWSVTTASQSTQRRLLSIDPSKRKLKRPEPKKISLTKSAQSLIESQSVVRVVPRPTIVKAKRK